jgi:hypothetical protein
MPKRLPICIDFERRTWGKETILLGFLPDFTEKTIQLACSSDYTLS